jgi:nickel/cobalt transporter (NicO) family protein
VVFELLVEVQRSIRDIISGYLGNYAETGDVGQLLSLLPLVLVFGIAHALTPGHSKTVLASYVAGSGTMLRKALGTSVLLSFVHITSAVLLATIATTLITRTLVGAGQAPALELVSRVAILLVGSWMIVRSFLRAPHMHGEAQGFAFLAGLIPCPLTLMIMTLAVSKGIPEAGLVFALAMFGGVVLVLSAVALLAYFARQTISRMLRTNHEMLGKASRLLELLCGLLLILIALHELR